MNKKSIVAIFAHPDDEAFGPAGTLALYAETHDVYIICVTKGQAGNNNHPSRKDHIADIREQEMADSAQLLGVKNVFFLDYEDGTLCNKSYHQIADSITEVLQTLNPETLITYEPQGLSGHLDHVAVSMITSYIFEKSTDIKTVMYYCLPEEYAQRLTNYFIYVPPGYKPEQIDKVIDISSVWDKKVAAIHKHQSQIKDIKRMEEKFLNNVKKEECFLIKEKKLSL